MTVRVFALYGDYQPVRPHFTLLEGEREREGAKGEGRERKRAKDREGRRYDMMAHRHRGVDACGESRVNREGRRERRGFAASWGVE